jgi:hypothetical protein
VRSRATSVARVVSTEHISEFLAWPETPKHKGRRRVERQPFAITSGKYQEMFEKKHFAKAAGEEKKQGWKRKCEEAKQEKKNKVQNLQLKGNFSKKYMTTLDAIQCTTFAREESNVDMSFAVMIVKIYITNYAHQNNTRNSFQFWNMVTLLCVTAATEKKTDKSANEMTQVEENDDD